MKNKKTRSPKVLALLNLAIAELNAGPFSDEFLKTHPEPPTQSWPCIILWPATPPQQREYHETAPSLAQLSLGQALIAKSSEYWLCLGEAAQARIEWGKLSAASRRHPLVIKLSLEIHRGLGLPAPRL